MLVVAAGWGPYIGQINTWSHQAEDWSQKVGRGEPGKRKAEVERKPGDEARGKAEGKGYPEARETGGKL